MVRLATIEDRLRVIRLLKDSVAAGETVLGHKFALPFDVMFGMKLFDYHATEPNALNMVLEVDKVVQGVLLAIADTHPFGPIKWARETVWYIHPNHREGLHAFRMLHSLEDWAKKDQQCKFVGIGRIGENPSLHALYTKLGYEAVETYYLKELGRSA